MARALIFGGCLGYFLIFRHYGFQLEDEGTLLFQFSRVLDGQFPYSDFFAGYTPGYFHLGAFILDQLGNSTEAVRVCLAVVNASSAVALYSVARAVAGRFPALALTLLWVAFLPVFPGEFASFNVPYPTWFSTLAWMGLALCLLAWVKEGRARWLALAGVAASCAFALKPNAGAFAFASAVWVVALFANRERRVDEVLAIAASLAMAAGVWVAFGLSLSAVDLAVQLGPVLVLVWYCARGPRGRPGPPRGGGRLPSTREALAVLAVSFAPLTLLWAIPVLARLGLSGFLTQVLFIGSDWKQAYFRAYPQPELYAVLIVAGAVVLALMGRFRGWRLLNPVVPLSLAMVSALGLILWKRNTLLMPESFASSVIWQLENASFWMFPVVNWAGLLLLASLRRSTERADELQELSVVLPVAIAMYLQLYPRADFMHLVTSAPFSAVLGAIIAMRVSVWWNRVYEPSNFRVSRFFRFGVLATLCLLLSLKIGLLLPSFSAWPGGQALVVDTPTVKASLEPQASDDLEALAGASAYLKRYTDPGEAVFAFPALGGLLYAAGLTSAAPHDYWFPGEPDHGEERSMVAQLRRNPPRFVVALNSGWRTFRGSPAYFSTARSFVVANYRLVARYGRFDLLARNDIVDSLEPARWQPGGPMSAAVERTLAWRRQAARRWMRSLSVDEAASATLDREPAEAILVLRAIRDGGDIRTAGWLISGYNSSDKRVKSEALRTMIVVAQRYFATRHRWANDAGGESYRPWLLGYSQAVEELEGARDRRAVVFARALAEVIGE
ncbi:MAG: ArnT family glycosyltransferase [Candidatus Binatia bacterium]